MVLLKELLRQKIEIDCGRVLPSIGMADRSKYRCNKRADDDYQRLNARILRMLLAGHTVPEISRAVAIPKGTVQYRIGLYRQADGWMLDMRRVKLLLKLYPEA